MNHVETTYGTRIYAGVLGKILGVYLGRPVEGWAYEKIRSTFGALTYYKHRDCGVPLIVADDDISGTFAFFRALEDCGYPRDLTAQDVGNAWLNYNIEDKTILWWGGLGRSTEHTAYLNLKAGIPAPRSGSIEQNGQTLAEQIGAQIFMDAFAMACPEDPELAVHLVRNAASVSHDGVALDAACYLAAMEAMAFGERRLDKLMDEGLHFVTDSRLISLVEDVRSICARESDWRTVRDRLDERYGYHRYPGCCHMIPNHAMVLASLLLGGDDFQRSIEIAASAGWDTDCNAGNVGCLNGIRLGLEGIDGGADFRTPAADQLYVVSSDGGAVISDAVQQTRAILRAVSALHGEAAPAEQPRFAFEYPGALQGFSPCPYADDTLSSVQVENTVLPDGSRALALCCRGIGPGVQACVSTQTFLEKGKTAQNFSTVASPTLYETQTLRATLWYDGSQSAAVRLYVLYYDVEEQVRKCAGPAQQLCRGWQELTWMVPRTDGMPIFRVGFAVESDRRFDGRVQVGSLDWSGAPRDYRLEGMLMTSIWNTNPSWLQTWTSSAKQFQADFNYTICASHPAENGVATIGTEDWSDYTVSARLIFSLHRSGGLVFRCKGHRRYYVAVLTEGRCLQLVCRKDDQVTILGEAALPYQEDVPYALSVRAVGDLLTVSLDGRQMFSVRDNTYTRGGAGVMIDHGTMCIDGFAICGQEGVS